MKARCHFFILLFLLAAAAVQPAAAQLGYDLTIKKPAPYENRELKAEKTGDKKFKLARRVFQNTYTHYNYFFNANAKLNEIVARAKTAHRDDYAKLLPFYNYELSATAQDGDELDSVIYKSKTGILLHDLRNDWIDDLYLLWGQSYYLKQQFDSAYQMFQFINYAFADKEKDGYYKYIGSHMDGAQPVRITSNETLKFPKGLIADPPARNGALLWEVRSLIGANTLTEAGSLINALRNDPDFPERLREDLEEVQALWFYRQSRWDSTAYHLTAALPNAKNAQERARWEYLAAQLFEKTNKIPDAETYYNKAISDATDPLLDLYARLNLIRINKEGGENYIDQNIAALLKMARRDRYTNYRDAIYYAAGEMELARSNFLKAQEYFLKAAKYRGEDPTSAGKGFLQLASLFYQQGNYTEAARFYDSIETETLDAETVQFIAARRDILQPLVAEIGVVQRQDSLQSIAALPEKERTDYLKKLARKLRKEHGLADDATATTNNPAAALAPTAATDLFGGSDTKGEWYFYNENTRTQGAAVFTRVWGKRPNVDNWRRYSDVSAQLRSESIDNTRGVPGEIIVDENETYSYDGLLKNLPLTDEALLQSNDSVANALYASGRMLTDKLEDYRSAVETYETLRRRFPAFQNGEEVLFQLYFSYTKLGNAAKAAEMKALLQKNFPDGRYTGIAATGKDATLDTTSRRTTRAYEHVYDLFIAGKFEEARVAKQAADSLFGDSNWDPQLLYIQAVYNIKQGDDSAAKEALNQIVEQAGDGPMADKATTLLDVLSRRNEIEQELRDLQIERPEEEVRDVAPQRVVRAQTNQMATDTALAQQPLVLDKPVPLRNDAVQVKPAAPAERPKVFTYAPADTHFAMVLLNNVDVVFGNEAKNAFARYNREKYYNLPLEINLVPLSDSLEMVLIGGFQNIQDAVDYVQKAKVLAPREIVPWLKADKYRFSLISENNLQLLEEKKNLAAYETFLDQNLPVHF